MDLKERNAMKHEHKDMNQLVYVQIMISCAEQGIVRQIKV